MKKEKKKAAAVICWDSGALAAELRMNEKDLHRELLQEDFATSSTERSFVERGTRKLGSQVFLSLFRRFQGVFHAFHVSEEQEGDVSRAARSDVSRWSQTKRTESKLKAN